MCDPVGIIELCARLNRSRSAFDQWQARGVGFPEPTWTIGGRPAWDWPVVERWALETGRLSRDGGAGS